MCTICAYSSNLAMNGVYVLNTLYAAFQHCSTVYTDVHGHVPSHQQPGRFILVPCTVYVHVRSKQQSRARRPSNTLDDRLPNCSYAACACRFQSFISELGKKVLVAPGRSGARRTGPRCFWPYGHRQQRTTSARQSPRRGALFRHERR
jgi:hypothetical protein